jgi:hypothetical protein
MTRAVLWLDVALVVVALGACRGARSPEPADLARYRSALEAAQTTLAVAGALCAALPPGERAACHDQLAALDEAVTVGAQVLQSAETCQRQSDTACVQQAAETARERLPELLRLLGRETAPASSGGGS